MSYQALYRTFRSQRFDEVVGQNAVMKTLQQMIVQKKTSHAYLFTGPRGTGKTSVARIFAKAVNCRHSENGEPCNSCDSCVAITKGNFEDVLEVDAASHNGVEEIRNIRDTVKYPPQLGDYKVYIIDEVHMLSTSAFNALLKTLEEPPEKVIFVLATTEVHKVLPTILSRVQRFDFKRISVEEIVCHLEKIVQQLSVETEKEALYVLARASEGGMRDALSLLDQAISFAEERVSVADVLVVTGSLTSEKLDQYVSTVFSGNVSESLAVLTEILEEGKEAKRFLEDLICYFRDLLLYQEVPQLVEEKTSQVTERFQQLAGQCSAEQLYAAIDRLSEVEREIRLGSSASVCLEIVTIQLASVSEKVDAGEFVPMSEFFELKEALYRLKEEVAQLRAAGLSAEPVVSEVRKPAPIPKTAEGAYKNPTEKIYQALFSATKEHLRLLKEVWADLLASLSAKQRAMMKASEPVAASASQMVVSYDYDILAEKASQDGALQRAVVEFLEKSVGFSPELIIVTSSKWPVLRREFIEGNREKLQEEKVKHPSSEEDSSKETISERPKVVEQAVQLFGEEIVNVAEEE